MRNPAHNPENHLPGLYATKAEGHAWSAAHAAFSAERTDRYATRPYALHTVRHARAARAWARQAAEALAWNEAKTLGYDLAPYRKAAAAAAKAADEARESARRHARAHRAREAAAADADPDAEWHCPACDDAGYDEPGACENCGERLTLTPPADRPAR